MWYELQSQEDIEGFMTMVTDFHDSCLKEMRYSSGAYSDGRFSHLVNDKRVLNMVFHGFLGLHTAIEIEFTN